jgi:hypothetical protein
MGCTREELLRWLPGATRGAPAAIAGDAIALTVGAGRVELELQERPPRRIALLALPVLAVRFRFVGLGEAERVAFLHHFDAYTRRGGG